MNIICFIVLFVSYAGIAFAADDVTKRSVDDSDFHKPFTLKLYIDKENLYEEKFEKVPFVRDGYVFLFKGDEFGINIEMHDNVIRSVNYEPDIKKADVALKFSQELPPDGSPVMTLRIRNNTKHHLNMEALMTVPRAPGVSRTRILPVWPGLTGFEAWPHPIIQLALRNIQVAK
jgi:hypothetical protein